MISGGRQEYEWMLSLLYKAEDEESVIYSMKEIVKKFTSDFYLVDLNSNSYFSSLLDEVSYMVLDELLKLKSKLEIKIENLSDDDNKKLKWDCRLLIKEIENKEKDLKKK